MKNQLTVALGLLAAALSPHAALANAPSEPSGQLRVEIPVEALLTPAVGFEEKNNIQVVLYGGLPNTCYTLGDTTTEKVDDHTIRVRQFAVKDTAGMCANESSMPIHMQMVVPFMQEVSLGQLGAGDYQFVFNKRGAGNTLRNMNVARNITPETDTLPYAAVSNVQSRDVINGLEHVIVNISGVLNSTCTVLNKKIKVMREDDVLVLLPTVRVRPGVICAQIMVPFEKQIDLGVVPPGIHLIHTRSMNGRAVNKVISVMR